MANPNYWYAKKYKAYAEKTRHLCLAEHGAYNLLLDHYYETRGKSQAFALANAKQTPSKPQANASALFRVCMCQSDDERAAVLSVIAQFFIDGNDGYLHNGAADEEMGLSANVSLARSEAGKLGAEIKKQKALAKANAEANAKQKLSKTEATGEANDKTVTKNNNKEQPESKTEDLNVNPTVEQKPLDLAVEPLILVEDEGDPIAVIFAYWQKVMNSPKSALDDKRKKLIGTALKSYSPADICKAIRGCSKTPHNMGQNKQNTKYNGLNLILRDADHIDYFINLDDTNARPGKETVEQMNARVAAEFLGDAQDDENTIEMEA